MFIKHPMMLQNLNYVVLSVILIFKGYGALDLSDYLLAAYMTLIGGSSVFSIWKGQIWFKRKTSP